MSAPSTLGLSVELLLRVIEVKYGYFTFRVTVTRTFTELKSDIEARPLVYCPRRLLDSRLFYKGSTPSPLSYFKTPRVGPAEV